MNVDISKIFNSQSVPDKGLQYEFAKNAGSEEVGFNDSVTTNFKGHLAYFLARESLQNVIDVVRDGSKPVVAKYDLLKINASDIPQSAELQKILLACKQYYHNNQQSVEFFERAHQAIEKNKKIPVLKISDFNTTGLSGADDDIEGHYYNFLKSSGASSKRGGDGGSFGLGKGAYYAASSFHTIFVSSVYDANKCVFQGKLRLVTHQINGEKYQSTGSYGLQNQVPVRDKSKIPKLFQRDQQGTDIYIIGFYDEENWETEIIKSVLNNFWMSIWQGKLTVQVSGHEINAGNIYKLMFKYFNEEDKDTADNPNPLQYFLTYISDNSIEFNEDLPTLGTVTLKIQLKEKYNKQIAFFRKTGMLIHKQRRAVPVPFAGVFRCMSKKGNEILRAMENPQHDKWDAENAREKTAEMFEKAKKAKEEIKEFIRKNLRSVFDTGDKEAIDIPGLEKYLSIESEKDDELSAELEGPSGSVGDVSEDETAHEGGAGDKKEDTPNVLHPIVVAKRSAKVKAKKDKGGGSGKKGWVPIDITYRAFASVVVDTIIHNVVIHADANRRLQLIVRVGTEDSLDAIPINHAFIKDGTELKVDENLIENVVCDKDGLAVVKLEFRENGRYSLSVEAYENR